MRDEQQPQWAALLPESLVVEGGHDGLARSRSSDDEVLVVVLSGPGDIEVFEDLLLVRVRPDLETRDGDAGRSSGATAGDGEGFVEPVAVPRRVVGDEGRVGPVAVEGGSELLEELRGVHAGEPDVPLESVE